MLIGFHIVLQMTLWFGLQKEPVTLASPSLLIVAPVDGAPSRIEGVPAADHEVDGILAAWEAATIRNRRTGCSFLRFRYDHEGKIEYRAEGEINVYQWGRWEYRAEPANVLPIVLRRQLAAGRDPYELLDDSAERLLVSRNKVIIHRETPDGLEERSVPTSSNLFGWDLPDWLSPFVSREVTRPRDLHPDDDRLVDVSGIDFRTNGVTPSSAIVPTFLIGMRRQEILKRYNVTLVKTVRKNWIGLRFKPHHANADSSFGEVRIVLNREGFVPEALMLKSVDGKTDIVHCFGDWTFEKKTAK